MIEVFIIQDEVEGGWMRPVKPGETLNDFIKETVQNREGWDSITHARGWEEADEEIEDDLTKLTAVYNPVPYDDEWESTNIEHIESMSDEDLIILWSRARVPDDTKFIWYGDAHPDLDGWCGMGGNGYIEMIE